MISTPFTPLWELILFNVSSTSLDIVFYSLSQQRLLTALFRDEIVPVSLLTTLLTGKRVMSEL